ncbi:unnamed protein product [Angiostrongylus costaricensis]|uniref:Uncharacterized protein n=1 Tax=Angiostrongylus costaricensis TaxID=334426 RepID=A0A0R3PRK7_ANGCS|nr:unnamed protein product [Angiostrongylus costaricensis]
MWFHKVFNYFHLTGASGGGGGKNSTRNRKCTTQDQQETEKKARELRTKSVFAPEFGCSTFYDDDDQPDTDDAVRRPAGS